MTIPIIASLLLGAASAKAHATPLVGTWTGTVGKEKVNVCFQSFPDGGYVNGSYYYLRHREPIRLENLGDKIWLEPDSNRMVFETIADSVATGRWIGFKSGKELPVRLRFLGVCPEDEGNTSSPCACDLFNKPIETMPAAKIDTQYAREGDSAVPPQRPTGIGIDRDGMVRTVRNERRGAEDQ